MPEQGDIVLVPVPFTDLSSMRRRPVIVLSNKAYHSSTPDMIVVAMTSNPNQSAYSFVINTGDLVQGTLNHPGTVRADKVIVKTFGRVGTPVLDRIRAILGTILQP